MTNGGTYPVGSSHNAITTGDFNRDGRSDLAVTNTGSNTVSVPLNDGGTSTPPSLRIGGATVTEGNAGNVSAIFTVILSAASTQTVTVAYATGSGTPGAATTPSQVR